ncbi:PstS family phosphate ABC transporter substrate-binding protein [Natronomonas halophila]|uniref:PstS family phosphate ABC transporter substrate-binding protein n=1 Tax=Natronomonas halophila TaxID=2747817 RepID=UPI001FE651C7|nr:PstS family phosphate ABC transporter substrate-binding protein [Natronomonas halophila]
MEASRFGDLTRRDALKAFGGAGAVAVAGCTETENGDSGGLSGNINIAGSSTVFPLMSAMAEEFSSDYSGVNIDISSTGTGGGFSNHFCPANTDFNNASREIMPEEEELCADNNVDYIELTVATDALTVVVNNEADFVDCLTVEELASIWESDAVETWDEVRDEFPNEPIERYGAADTSGTYDYFIENVQGAEAGHTDDYQATERDDTIAQGVAGSEYAIGYFGFSYYYNNPDEVKALGIDNGDGCVKPSLDTASSGEYQPLSRRLYTYPSMSSLAKDHVAEFARFVVEQTTNEELVAQDVGYVPLNDSRQEEEMNKLESAIEDAQS